ncbi:PLD nuclease N-terminal domain-containing protein [Gordonia sp. HY285]|uniref:PLD nuclease N-terminal domain-containing protein n=1 Tax=Gordonia liuliyuniae TaxID=2911517 RepID=UPI001F3037D6|nr:PLD nuclease N-terminal domain-containing protein [Gordonia liuliyuniae]MCF8609084.1 PLD nuclease N-terminal domain-containing protein [Gordonia liuliyuniae]
MPYFGLIVLVVWVAALIDVIVAEEYRVRHLPKVAWVLIVILLPLVGSIIWFLVGRPEGVAASPPTRTTGFPEYERPGYNDPEYRAAIAAREDAEFRRKARERAQEQRRRAQEKNGSGENEEPEGD